ncbi:hypothetical protein GCM10009839_03730 [Catenulispora yoronensis]|uniref:Uncharacterized protein n=1 Tax=Catenulispora yoronensis TaxID=450799 RepID=A0ABP5EZM3_9ACTN
MRGAPAAEQSAAGVVVSGADPRPLAAAGIGSAGGRFPGSLPETNLTKSRSRPSARLQIMSVQTLFDILLVLVAVLVLWFASFVVLRLFKGQG